MEQVRESKAILTLPTVAVTTLTQTSGQFSLKGKTAVLTGAARGLGFAFAEALAEAGANIAVLDLASPGERLAILQTKYGVKSEYYQTDVTNRENVTEVIERIEQDFGSVDIK